MAQPFHQTDHAAPNMQRSSALACEAAPRQPAWDACMPLRQQRGVHPLSTGMGSLKVLYPGATELLDELAGSQKPAVRVSSPPTSSASKVKRASASKGSPMAPLRSNALSACSAGWKRLHMPSIRNTPCGEHQGAGLRASGLDPS